MIDFISNSARPNIPLDKSHSSALPTDAPVQASAPVPASPQTEVTTIAVKATVAELAKSPPIDLEAVGRIKEEIARGAYPVDLDKIAEKLMESFIETRG